jgi:molybdate transport system substrate-binding protein
MMARALTVLRIIVAALVLAIAPAMAHADEINVAVAANFTQPAKDIADLFAKKTCHKVLNSFGPSGGLASQIRNGAPFVVFLSADAETPTALEKEGLGLAGTRFVYAYGTLTLWSATPGKVDAKGDVLKTGAFDKLAIADPAVAPYGVAAVDTLKHMGLYDKLAPKIVKGASIAQAYGFVDTGAAELGFVALSQVIKRPANSYWIVPRPLYSPIDQQAILLQPGKNSAAAKAYIAFLKSPEAIAIIKGYGYEVR